MNVPMIPVVDANVKGKVKWLSIEDAYYVCKSANHMVFEYHTNEGIFHSISRFEDLQLLLSDAGMVTCDRAIMVNTKNAIDYDKDLRIIHFPDDNTTVAMTHDHKIKKLLVASWAN